MAKSKAAPKTEAPKTEAPKTEAPAVKMRGPRGVPESAVINLLAVSNPKRVGSKAHAVFEHYKDGMTVGEFADSLEAAGLGKESTPNLVYDAKHGNISIDGYNPGEVVVKTPKEVNAKAEPAPKKKGKASVVEAELEDEEIA